jgi:hypothetical protein
MSTKANMSESHNQEQAHAIVSPEEWIAARRELLKKDSSRFIMGRDLAFRRRKGCECGSSESCGNLGRRL